MPTDHTQLQEFKVNEHVISYEGRLLCGFKLDHMERLIAFEGYDCSEVIIDGKNYQFANSPLKKITFLQQISSKSEKGSELFWLSAMGSGMVYIPFYQEFVGM